MFGGHTEVIGSGSGEFRGIEAINMGQQNVLARYPFHFHLAGNKELSYLTDNSVHDSFFRCFTIHGTHNLTLSRNTGYNIDGHCFYIEDGVEEGNTISYNAVAFVHPIGRAAGGSCSGEKICSGCDDEWLYLDDDDVSSSSQKTIFTTDDLVIPADTAASAYYVSNAYNNFIGNIGSGGWSVFSFINMKTPLGKYLGEDYGNLNPYNRPTMEFNGNIAHSSGFYWGQTSSCGSCIYAGGELRYDYNQSSYTYFTGRITHDTIDSDGENAWIVYKNTKTYLCQLGINFWG